MDGDGEGGRIGNKNSSGDEIGDDNGNENGEWERVGRELRNPPHYDKAE